MGQEWVSQCPVMAYTCFMPWLSSVGRKKKSKGTSANIKWNQSPGFVCSQREVKRAILSRAANLWSYLVDKSIAVSESKPECAVRELEGLPLAWCPQGPSRGVPACLFTLHLFRISAHTLWLLDHTKKYAKQCILWNGHPVTYYCTSHTMINSRESTICVQKHTEPYSNMCTHEIQVHMLFVPW